MGKIKQLKEDRIVGSMSQENLYPITKARAVYTDDGRQLQSIIDNWAGGSGGTGYTFIPHVSEDGVLSWTNNGGLRNPDPVNIKGELGANITNVSIIELD